jgi:hypothetical protein
MYATDTFKRHLSSNDSQFTAESGLLLNYSTASALPWINTSCIVLRHLPVMFGLCCLLYKITAVNKSFESVAGAITRVKFNCGPHLTTDQRDEIDDFIAYLGADDMQTTGMHILFWLPVNLVQSACLTTLSPTLISSGVSIARAAIRALESN